MTGLEQMERNIAKVWAEVLGYREINVHDTLFELGADSISMMKLADQMSKALNADVTLDRLMKYSSVTKLAEFVASGVSQAKQVVYPRAIIDPDGMHKPFGLTDVQMAYLMGRDVTYELGGVSTHIYFEYETQLDIARLSRSLRRVIDRHPMLRAVFLPNGEQVVLNSVPQYEIQADDVLSDGEVAVNRKIEEVRGRMSHHVRDAEKWPLFEFHAVKTSADTHRLFVSVDMLIADGSSYDMIAREMLAFYHNPELELPKLDITFRDYMNTYMEFKRSETYMRDRQYWLDQLEAFPPAPALPLVASPAEVGVPSFSRLFKSYPKEAWDRVKAVARRNNVTQTALLATAYASVLAYWSNQSRLAINLTVFNRFPFHEQINELVGDFTSIMLLGVDLGSASTFWDRTRHVQDRMMEALGHRHYDGIEFVREYARYHGLGNQAAMPVVFTSLLQGDGWNSWADIGEQVLGVSQTPQVVLDHQAIEVQGELMLNWDYVDTLFDPELIHKMFAHYTGMIEAWMAEEEASLPSLPEQDRAFIEAYNGTAEPIPAETLHGLFMAQAARTPEREAVRFGEESLSYRELDRRSNQVARYLLERGVGRNDLIGVFGKRHPSTIVSILGILKAGAAYVPVDPDYPEDRVQYILSNSACKVFLGEGAYETEGIGAYSSDALGLVHHPEDLAYVIYTSGSTGRPKGVVITHQAAANTIQDMNRKFAVGPEDRILGISSLCFDLSVYDIFGALAAGAALVQIADQRDVLDMIDIVVRERISIWNSVPAILDLTVDTLEKDFVNTDLRVVLLSGDKIPLPLPDKVKKHFTNTAVISLGGATEASIWSIYYPIEEVKTGWKTIPYGMPLANQTFYVLNPQLELCPIGVQGELYIGGVGLAQCYLNDEEKTKAAFFVHPTFGPLYKTGDHGVWRPEGYIEFLGRIDHQVKIRGYRVELGEIEACLMQHPSVKNATVIDRTDAGGKKYLCAYIVPEAEADVQTAELREHLGGSLTDYMVPSYFVAIEAIPLTPNGKVDRKALPEPEIQAANAAIDREPLNETEAKLQAICQEVLGLPYVSVIANFFELGMNSVLMVQTINHIAREMNAHISFRDFVRQNNIEVLAQFVDSGMSEAKQIKYPQAIIDPDSLYEPFGLTDVQMAYLMGRDESYELGGTSTHVYLEYDSQLDMARLRESMQRVIERHPMLRSVFLPNGEQQILSTMPRFEIQVEDVSGADEATVARKLEDVRNRMTNHVFDPEQWPLFEFHAVKISADTHRLFIGLDALISDASSFDKIAREMMTFYHDPNAELSKLDITFRDYINTLNEFKQSEVYLEDRKYWLDQLETFPPAPALPLIASPAEVGVPTFSRLTKTYPKASWDRLKTMARQNNVTPSAVIATAFASVLGYWSNQSRLAINLTVFNRFPFHEQIDHLVGDFTSIMLLGIDLNAGSTFWERSRHVQDRLMEALQHRHYDGIEFIREYSTYHGFGKQAAMPVAFTSMLHGDGLDYWAEVGELQSGLTRTSQVTLDHQALEIHGGLMVNWDYVENLFDPELLDKMFTHYTEFLEAWMERGEERIPSLPEQDRAFIEAYNGTAEPIPAETLHGLFMAQAARTPEREAVRFGEESLSYRELDRRSNQVARYLLERGVGRNDLIGVFGKRHPSTIVSILGILKAGAAYVPVDPDYPEDRVQYILSNSACKVFLGEGAYETEGIGAYSSDALGLVHHPEDLAYVIYTSGSTGRPKGVVITHQAAANTIQDMNRKFAVGPEDRILGISSLCFDLSVYDIFGALAAGAALVQIADQRDVLDMIDIVVRERISIWNSVPAILDLTVDTLEKDFVNTDLRVVLLSGDKIPLPLPDKVKKHFTNTAVISLGGATEASIWSIYYPIEEVKTGWKTIPYGMPLANQTFYVLNPQLELCPIGVQGELYIGGVGLAQCYLNDEEKTKAAFFVHPTFGPLYKTGDHGVWRPEGYIEFLGRIDHQVKIRGYRVELGEIEACLMQHPSVKNATVIDRTDAGGKKYLCAYIVPEAEADVQTAELREHLGGSLTDYMVPSYFVAIEAIPLTPNGKVDRKALPEPEIKAADMATDREPLNESEATLQAICQEVLGLPHVSVIASFFELGMNSVLMVQMINQIGRIMNAKISFRDFVRQNNIEELAAFIGKDGSAAKTAPVVEYALKQPDPENMGEEFPLTDIQMAYLLGRNQNFELGGISNHGYVELLTELDMDRYQAALNKLIKRHPMLRAVVLQNGMQKILLDVPEYEVVVEDLRLLGEEAREARIVAERNRMSHYMFTPDQWPLFEFKSFRLTDDTHLLLAGYDMLIADQASMDLFSKELMAMYRGEELPELEFTFRDYMIAFEEFKNTSETYKRDREFWMNKLESFPSAPVLPLKEDPLKVKKPHFDGLAHLFTPEQWAELKRQANQRNVTPSALLATAYATVLAHWSNQPHLAVNMTVFNRLPFHKDVPAILGDFTSVLLIDVNLQPERTLWEEASELQTTLMDALEHRHYDGVEFIREISRHNNLGTKAAMPFIFNSTLFGDQTRTGTGWVDMGRMTVSMNQTSQLYIDNQVSETVDNELSVKWLYVDQLFEPQVIQMMFDQYVGIVRALIEGKERYQFELTESDAAQIDRYNQTEEPIRRATLHELFAEQAKRVPEGIAVKLDDHSFTYRELDQRSNRIARALRAAGVKRGDGIGVLAQRCPETIANMLGILKAGAAYVPVDPAYPEDRQTYILENSKCKLFLQPDYYDQHAQSHSDAALDDNNHPEDVAYVIYTSGSTGRPKGVVIAHDAAANTIQDINNKFNVTEKDRIIGVSSMCFDLSVYDIFGALSTGATLVMIPNQRDPEHILNVIEREQITFWNSAPAIMDMLVENLAHQSDEGSAAYQWSDAEVEEPVLKVTVSDEVPAVPTYRWSPKASWELIENGIRIGENEYVGVAKQAFPALYTAAVRGFQLQDLESLVPNVPGAELRHLVQQLIDDRTLISELPKPDELFGALVPHFDNKYGEDVIYNKVVQEAFVKQQLDRTYKYQLGTKIGLSQSEPYPAEIEERRSVRDFDRETKIPLQVFADMLSVWKQKRAGDQVYYNYASAGGLYPIDVFVYVKENRIEGLSQGLYYYSPRENALFVVDSNAVINESAHFFPTKGVAGASAFSIYLIYNAEASMPKYGGRGMMYALLDAGVMVSTLNHVAEMQGIGLCSIGDMMFDRIEPYFQLNRYQMYIHSIEGGYKKDRTNKRPAPAVQSAQASSSGALTPPAAAPQAPVQAVKPAQASGSGTKEFTVNTSLRAVLLSGDWIPLTLPEKIREHFPNADIVSLGGATEASIWSIYYPIDEVQEGWTSIPYGRPLANQTFHVLNYRQEPCPVGVVGELCIGGVGLAEGYHNDVEKTEAAFFEHPQLGRLYRTGDFGVLHEAGYIEFMGRKDSQVKIRGYRVELNEIASNLLKHPDVSNGIVIDRTDSNRKKYLCAYYVTEPGAEVTSSDLREALQKDLPEYMVPSYFVALAAIPLTPNGKVDRKALPEPDLSEGRTKHVEPKTELEKQLVDIWQQVLETEGVGTQDDFFDIGGNSLLVVRVKGHLDKLFPDCLSFVDLFTYTTIEQLAMFLEEQR